MWYLCICNTRPFIGIIAGNWQSSVFCREEVQTLPVFVPCTCLILVRRWWCHCSAIPEQCTSTGHFRFLDLVMVAHPLCRRHRALIVPEVHQRLCAGLAQTATVIRHKPCLPIQRVVRCHHFWPCQVGPSPTQIAMLGFARTLWMRMFWSPSARSRCETGELLCSKQ